jgi:tetratricopeptide (TPR) repeat protein
VVVRAPSHAVEYAKLIAATAIICFMTIPTWAQVRPIHASQTESMQQEGPAKGTITVFIRGPDGGPISAMPTKISLSSERGEVPGFAQQNGNNSWVFSDVETGDTYEVEVKADGYETATESVSLLGSAGTNANVIVFMTPAGEKVQFHPPAGQFVLAPRAQKEVEKGTKDLRVGKIPSAQQHFQKAYALAPGNPYVNYVMGMGYLMAGQLPQARPYLERSVSIDPKEPPALLALATLRFRSTDYTGAIQTLNQDLQIDPTSWKAEWMVADCYLREREFEQARSHSEKALSLGKQDATQAQLVLGQALAGLGERGGAVKVLQSYLAAYPHDPNADKIQSFIAQLQRPAVVETSLSEPANASKGPSTVVSVPPETVTISTPAQPVELPPKENWAPVDVDAENPFVISGAGCPLAKVLAQEAKNAERFVTDLQEFSATEEYESVEVKHDERLETPYQLTFTYFVYIEKPNTKLLQVKEIRDTNRGPTDMPGRVVDMGAPGLVLAFHPMFRDDFQWQCEGLGEWKDQPAWLVHFEQRSDRPTSLLAAFDTASEEFALPLKGRAWISTKTGQVVRLEADLVRPVESINLKRQHFVIEYAPVSFSTHKVTLWLPESVDVYLQYNNHYLHHHHQFSNFKLFWVGTSEKIGEPKTDASPQKPHS